MDPTLIDHCAISEIPPDITFKFKEVDGDEVEATAHKMILAMVSKVFRNMFYVHNTKSATEMAMEDTTKPPFQIMLDAVYNVKPMKESLKGKTVDEMFAVLYLVSKYEIPKLLLDVKESLSSFPITEDNVLEVAADAMEYLTNFDQASQILLLVCAKFLKSKVGDGESFVRFVADNGDRMATVQKLAVLMKDIPPFPTTSKPPSPINSIWCDGCQRKRTECLDGKSVTMSNVKVGVKVIKSSSNDPNRIGVVVRENESCGGYWFILWEDNVEMESDMMYGGIYLFKCR